MALPLRLKTVKRLKLVNLLFEAATFKPSSFRDRKGQRTVAYFADVPKRARLQPHRLSDHSSSGLRVTEEKSEPAVPLHLRASEGHFSIYSARPPRALRQSINGRIVSSRHRVVSRARPFQPQSNVGFASFLDFRR